MLVSNPQLQTVILTAATLLPQKFVTVGMWYPSTAVALAPVAEATSARQAKVTAQDLVPLSLIEFLTFFPLRFASAEGRIRLLHAFAHIEFNAVNIALDAVYRFRGLGTAFIGDWLGIAAEEAEHFRLIETELGRRGSGYGDYDAHGGLWDMVCRTRTDPLHRMALVPRVMKARGLDVSPGMIARFRQFGDADAARILERIYHDEINHVRIGNRWFEQLCKQHELDPAATFRELIGKYLGGNLRGPFNREARIAAGFEAEELERLEQGF